MRQTHKQICAKLINNILPNPLFISRILLKCDSVIHLKNGNYGLVEIKLGGDKLIEEGAANLIKLKKRIDSEKMNEPCFMMILCAVAPFAYMRNDGVMVVPIGCLRD